MISLEPAWLKLNPTIINGCNGYINHHKTNKNNKSYNIMRFFGNYTSPCYDENKEYCDWRSKQNYNSPATIKDYNLLKSVNSIEQVRKKSKYVHIDEQVYEQSYQTHNATLDDTLDDTLPQENEEPIKYKYKYTYTYQHSNNEVEEYVESEPEVDKVKTDYIDD